MHGVAQAPASKTRQHYYAWRGRITALPDVLPVPARRTNARISPLLLSTCLICRVALRTRGRLPLAFYVRTRERRQLKRAATRISSNQIARQAWRRQRCDEGSRDISFINNLWDGRVTAWWRDSTGVCNSGGAATAWRRKTRTKTIAIARAVGDGDALRAGARRWRRCCVAAMATGSEQASGTRQREQISISGA